MNPETIQTLLKGGGVSLLLLAAVSWYALHLDDVTRAERAQQQQEFRAERAEERQRWSHELDRLGQVVQQVADRCARDCTPRGKQQMAREDR